MSLRDFNAPFPNDPRALHNEPLGNSAGLEAFHTTQPEDIAPSKTPKIVGAVAVALMIGAAGVALYAQHIDQLDTGALVDLFRVEENACLLGTDALRDGVDVPGRSLRLVVFDKVPWPKPTILHKARRAKFGKGYDDLITRFRLKQAFGRLIRGPEDRGCFVILEGATPTRLLSAFPEKSPVKRCGLAEAIGDIRAFLGPETVTHATLPLITG